MVDVPVTLQRQFQQFFEFFVPQVQFLDRMVELPVVLRLQWQKTVEVPQLPFLGCVCSVRQWIHILRQRGRLWEKILVFYVNGYSAPEVDSRPALLLHGPARRRPRPCDDALRAVFPMFASRMEKCAQQMIRPPSSFFLETWTSFLRAPLYFAVFQQSADSARWFFLSPRRPLLSRARGVAGSPGVSTPR